MHTLTIYISDDCWSCEETHRLLASIQPNFPKLRIELVDTQEAPLPDGIFAVPTYQLNGKIISLGNPTRDDLVRQLTPLFDRQAAQVEMPQSDETA